MNDLELQQLLRMKECDLPSPEATERFIVDFQRRQRMALLKPSLWQQLQERLQLFFADFQVPTMAYVGATAIALFVSVVILQGTHISHRGTYASQHSLLLDEKFPPLNSLSFPAVHHIEPVSLDINSKDRDEDSLVSPLSYILQKKPLPAHSLSF